MKKVGTQVELDLSSMLKQFDAAYQAVMQQRKGWQAWDAVVKKFFPTLKQANAALKQTVGRLDELRHTEEGATEAGKEEINIRRAQIKSLRRVIKEYKETEAARKSLAGSEIDSNEALVESTQATTDRIVRSHEERQQAAEQGAQGQAEAAREAAGGEEEHTKALDLNIKKMILWAAGSASVFRLFMKARRAVEEASEELYKNTKEFKENEAAIGRAGKALILGVTSREQYLKFLRDSTKLLDQLSDRLIRYGATKQAVAEVTERARAGNEEGQALLMRYGRAVSYVHKTEEGQALIQDRVNELIKEYNELIEESTKETEDFTSAMDEMRKRTEDYNKALYQITEQRLTDMLQAQRDYNDSITELELTRQRKAEDDAIAAARRLEDIHRDFARRLAALEEKFHDVVLRAKKNFDKRKRRAAEMLADKLLSIERRYQDRLLDIERTYARSMYEAIATRDATAALQAMRRRKEDITDARRDRDRARADAFRDYRRRIRDLWESLKEQERLARESYENQLEDLLRSLAEQEEDHRISLRRREEDAALSYARSLVDLKQSFLDRLAAIQRQSALERRNAKIDYLLREGTYAAHLARMAAIWQSYQGTMTMPPSSMPATIPGFAEGGMMVVNRPTLAMFGEGGRPELVIAQPLPPTSHAHNITGGVTHQINATIQQSIAGMEGRIAGAVHQALADVIH